MAKSRAIQLIISAKDRASRIIKGIGGGIARFGKMSLTAFAGLTAGITAMGAALATLYSKLAQQIDEQAKQAAALGITNERLGAYRDAAGYAGIATGDLNNALRKMSQNVADAANGIGEGKDALEALGLDAEELRQAGPEKAFEAIIDRLSEMPNGIKKTGLAMDIFGRSGAAMANLTSQGLRQAQQDADTLGLKLSTTQAGMVEKANDAWGRIKNLARDFLQYIAATLAPGVQKAFDSAFSFIKKQDLRSWAAEAALGIAKAFQGTVVVLGAVGESILVLVRGLAAASSIANKLIGGVAAIKVSGTQGAIGTFEKKIAELESRGSLTDQQQKRLELYRKELAHAKEVLATYTNIADSAVGVDAALDSAQKTLASAQGFSMSPAAKKAMIDLQKAVDELNKKTEQTGEKAKESSQEVKHSAADMAKQYGLAKEQVENLGAVLERLSSKTWEVNLKVNKVGANTVEDLANQLENEADR